MTVESTTSRAQYATNGTTGPFTVPFYFLANSDVAVIYADSAGVETTLTLTTHYTLTGAGNPAGGTVTTVAAYAAGGSLTILRDVEIVQETDYVETDAFPAESHERALDRLTMIALQQREVLTRAVVFPPSDAIQPVLPVAADRSNMLMGFDSSGQVTATAPIAGSATALQLDLASTTDVAKGDAMVGATRTITGAVAMTGHSWKEARPLGVKETGAVGDGVADDSAKVQAALSGHDDVFLSPGTYRLLSDVTVTAPFAIRSSPAAVIVRRGVNVNGANEYHGRLEGLNLLGESVAGSIGVRVSNTHRVKLDSLSTRLYETGLQLREAWLTAGINCYFSFSVVDGADIANNGNSVGFFSSSFVNNGRDGVRVASSQGTNFNACDFENNVRYGVYIDASDNATFQCTGTRVDACYFENNATDIYVGGGTGTPALVSGCSFSHNIHLGAKAYAYVVENAFGTKIIHPDFVGATFTNADGNKPIKLLAASQNTHISPFHTSEVTAVAGSTVSIDTVQTGSFEITLNGSGNGSASFNFPAQYYQVADVQLNVYSTTAPAGTLGALNIKNDIGVTGCYVEVNGGLASATVRVRWRAGS